MQIDLYPHQVEAVEKLGPGSVLCGGVGSGKSRTSIAYFFRKICGGDFVCNGQGSDKKLVNPTDIYIVTTAKKRDSLEWSEELARFGFSTAPEGGLEGIRAASTSWNQISKFEDVRGAFFIFDEQRLVGSGAWVKSFYKIAKHNKWILLSATPGDQWSDYIPVFVANGFYRNKTEFSQMHMVYSRFAKYPRVEKYVGTKRLERLRDQILVDMPYNRKTVRHVESVMVGYDRELFDTVMKNRWNPYDDEPIQEVSKYFHLMRRVVNSDPERVGALARLIDEHPKLIVFYNFNYELKILKNLMEVMDYPYAEWNGHRHEEIPGTKKWVYLVQYTSGAEGWNCVETDAMCFYSLNYSYRVTEQAMGRIDRLNTPFVDLWYYKLRSTSKIDVAIEKALRSKKTFNRKTFLGGKTVHE